MADTQIDSAFDFLGTQATDSPLFARKLTDAPTFEEYARQHFVDKNATTYARVPLKRPLLNKPFEDGDQDRVAATWVNILRFAGDLPPRQDKPLSMLQTAQLIQNIALSRPGTRDEIYCQICRQISGNSNKASLARLWVLLSLCLGVFPPSPDFQGTVEKFVQDSPKPFRPFLLKKCQQLFLKGPRRHPCCSLELQATFTKMPTEISVSFYLGTVTFLCSSSTTAQEALKTLLENPLLNVLTSEDDLELALLLDYSDQMIHLGNGDKFIMDAICEAEINSGEDIDWKSSSINSFWTLVIRKQSFNPWWEGTNVNFLYAQVMEELRRGLCIVSDTNQALALLADRYFVDRGNVFSAQSFLESFKETPLQGIDVHISEQTIAKVKSEFDKAGHATTSKSEEVKRHIVESITRSSPIDFSKFYHDCFVTAGSVQHRRAVVAVNSEGVYILQRANQSATIRPSAPPPPSERKVLLKLPFSQFAGTTSCTQDAHEPSISTFELTCVGYGQTQYTITSKDANQIHQQVEKIYQGLCSRSKFVMAMLPYKSPGAGSTFLSFNKGDLIILPKPWAEAEQGGWCHGLCERTSEQGDFPSANVYVLPSVTRPPGALVSLFASFVESDAGL
eukprot:m.137189 g.137189  ORF g.137189 m.137189 type:complete len:620 (-) comp23982_c0_seq3:1128-2987(-)